MRILMVASEVPPVRSGVARAVGHLAAGARDVGHDVEVRSYEDGRLFSRDQVRLSTAAFGLEKRWLAELDLVHLHGPAPTLSDVLLLRRLVGSVPVPLLYTHHFTVWGEPRWLAPAYGLYDAVARQLARAATAVVTTTPSYKAHVEQTTGEGSVRVIPWGVVPAAEPPRLPSEVGPLSVLVVGQMRRYKGHAIAIEACVGLEGVQLTVAGQGDLLSEMQDRSREASNITVVAAPSDEVLEDLYRSHDVVLLPSTNVSEAFGIVLLEGMAHGCVPVASDLRGLADTAGPTGRLFAAGDAVQLRRVLSELAGDRSEVRQLSEASRERAATLSWERTVRSYLDLFDELVAAER